MSSKIWKVRYPYMVFEIIGHALEYGAVAFVDIRDILNSVRNRSYAKEYLNLCLQTGLLRNLSGELRANHGKFVPTPRGRYFYQAAQKNRDVAVRELLGSIPPYRFHVELLLAELTDKSAPQTGEIARYVSQVLPWFLNLSQDLDAPGDRRSRVWKSVGWTENSSHSYGSHGINHPNRFVDRFIDYSAYEQWDKSLDFTNRTDLTRVENLCQFLAEQRQRRLYLGEQFLSHQALAVMLLLMLAKGEGLSVDISRWPKAIEALQHLGVDIRQQNKKAYLISAVTIMFSNPSDIKELSPADKNLRDVFSHLIAASEQTLATNPTEAALTLDLRTIRQRLKKAPNQFFVPTELSDVDDVTTPSQVEIWRARPLWHQIEADFHEEVCNRVVSAASPKTPPTTVPSADILLTLDQLNIPQNADLETVVIHNPHLYILLMLLIDQPQSHISPTLIDDVWHYRDSELLPTLDALLQDLGYTVWSEGYEQDPERRVKMTRKLVGVLTKLGCAVIRFGRLELTGDFKRKLQMDYAYLANQTKYIRQQLRQAIESNIIDN